MLILDDYYNRITAVKEMLQISGDSLNLPALKAEAESLRTQTENPDFYKDLAASQRVNKRLRDIERSVEGYEELYSKAEELWGLLELIDAEQEESMLSEFADSLAKLEAEAEELHLSTLLSGAYDSNNAILSLHAGAGGTEAQDWVQMLMRMYTMYCDKNGFSVKVLDQLDGEEAGIKSVTFLVSGRNAYGYLKAEKGVHRLVRISPFDSNARRHTSFASLEVMPEIENDTDIKINPEELKIDTYRSGGAGGQHVNKTESAIRITHLPSGIVVQCQNERSQIQNRETAMSMLKGKLIELKERENMEKTQNIKGELKRIEWGSQIRSYVFQPYTLVKDHRTGYESGNIQEVMDGGITPFIFEYLKRS